MARGAGKNGWALFLLVLAGVVLGSFIGHLASGVSALSWLDYGMNFGLSNPIKFDIGVMVLTLESSLLRLFIILFKRRKQQFGVLLSADGSPQ